MSYVIDELEIFKYAVMNENYTEDEMEIPKKSTKQILNRISINIFKDTYYILYNALNEVAKYNIILTYDIYQQILSEQKLAILEDENITLFKDNNLTDLERADNIVDMCLAEYDLLCEYEVQEQEYLTAHMDLYLKTWCTEKTKQLIYNMELILGEGVTVGRTLYRGIEDVDIYYRKGIEIITKLLEGDLNNISTPIDTSKDTPEEIKARSEVEAESGAVSKSGMAEIDDNYSFRKGEIVVIQAGTGVGKTKLANNFGYNSLMMGKNVLYLSLEQKAERIFPMYQARHILEKGYDVPNLTDKEIIFKSYDYNHEPLVEESLQDIVLNQEYGRLKIDSQSVRALDIKQYLEGVWDSGFMFDVVVIDYFGLLDCTDRYKDLSNAINVLKTECKSFKGQGFLGIIPNQLDKQSEKDLAEGKLDGMTKTAGSETQFASRGADYVFTLEQPLMLKRVNKMRIHIGKVRLGSIVAPSFVADVDLGRILFTSNAENSRFDDEDDWED